MESRRPDVLTTIRSKCNDSKAFNDLTEIDEVGARRVQQGVRAGGRRRAARPRRRRRRNDAVAQSDPHAHRVGQEHAEDHQGDEAGRRGAAASRAGRDRRGAPVRAAAQRGARPTSRRACSSRRRAPAHPLLARRDRSRRSRIVVITSRPRPRRRLQLEPRRAASSASSSTNSDKYPQHRARHRRPQGRASTSSAADARSPYAHAEIVAEYRRATSDSALERARELAQAARPRIISTARSTPCYVVYNEFKSAITQVVHDRARCCRSSRPKLPDDAHALRLRVRAVQGRRARRRWCRCTSRSQLYRALLESIASEFGARMSRDGQRDQERQGDDRQPHAAIQPRPPGGDHQGADGDRRRRRGTERLRRNEDMA